MIECFSVDGKMDKSSVTHFRRDLGVCFQSSQHRSRGKTQGWSRTAALLSHLGLDPWFA